MCPGEKSCRAIIACASQYRADQFSANLCALDDVKTTGMCCKDVTTNKIPNFVVDTDIDTELEVRRASVGFGRSGGASNKMVLKSANSRQTEISNINNIAESTSRKGGNSNRRGTAEYSHNRFQRQLDGVYELGQYAISAALVAGDLKNELGNFH